MPSVALYVVELSFKRGFDSFRAHHALTDLTLLVLCLGRVPRFAVVAARFWPSQLGGFLSLPRSRRAIGRLRIPSQSISIEIKDEAAMR